MNYLNLDPNRSEDKAAIDAMLDPLDLRGVSRRRFMAMVGAGLAATAASPMLAGCKSSSSTSEDGKLSLLVWTTSISYYVEMNQGFEAACNAFGMSHSTLNGQGDSNTQLNNWQQALAQGIKGGILASVDGSEIVSAARLAEQNKQYMVNIWATQPWFTPWESGKYYATYTQPDEVLASSQVCTELFEAMGGKGNLVVVDGVAGNSAQIARSTGLDEALKKYPDIKLLGRLDGGFNSEDSQKAMSTLLSRYDDIQGCVAMNDDEADGCVAAMKAVGLEPGKDILIVGADGTKNAAKRIESGEQLATTANIPSYAGYFLTARLYDLTHGWEPSVPEGLMAWKSIILKKDNYPEFAKRYVDLPPEKQYNPTLMSQVKHKDDWDPQMDLYPQTTTQMWKGIPEPADYKEPEEYTKAISDGTYDSEVQRYKDHYKADALGPVPQ